MSLRNDNRCMLQVYVAECRAGDNAGKRVIVKSPTIDGIQALKDEYKSYEAIGYHPNVVRVIDTCYDQNSNLVASLVMSLCDSGTIDQYTSDVQQMRVGNPVYRLSEHINLMIHMPQGLDYIHSRGMVHRDIKGGNIFIDAEGKAVLGDLGMSCLVGDRYTYSPCGNNGLPCTRGGTGSHASRV